VLNNNPIAVNEEKSKKVKTVSALSLIGSHAINDGFTDVLNPIYATIASHLGFSASMIGGLTTSMNATNALFKLPSGLLLSITGKNRLVLSLGLMIQALAMLLLSFMDNYWAMFTAMAFVGIGWSIYHPAHFSLMASCFDKKKNTFLAALSNISGTLGPVVYVAAAGLLTTIYDWRTALQVICLVSIILTVIIHLTLPGRAIEQSSTKPEITVQEMVKGIINNKAFLLMCLLGSFRGLAHRGITIFMPLFLGLQMGLSASTIGIIYSCMVLSGIVGQAAVGYFGDRLGILKVLLGILIVAGISTGLISSLLNITAIIGLLLILGFCDYSMRTITWSFTMAHSALETMSMSLSIIDLSNQMLSTFSPIIGGILVDLFGLRVAILFYGAVYLLAALVAVILNQMKGKEQSKV